MDFISSTYDDAKKWVTRPFSQDMSVGNLLLILVLFIIVGFIVFDSLRILKSWMDAAVVTAVDAVT